MFDFRIGRNITNSSGSIDWNCIGISLLVVYFDALCHWYQKEGREEVLSPLHSLHPCFKNGLLKIKNVYMRVSTHMLLLGNPPPSCVLFVSCLVAFPLFFHGPVCSIGFDPFDSRIFFHDFLLYFSVFYLPDRAIMPCDNPAIRTVVRDAFSAFCIE